MNSLFRSCSISPGVQFRSQPAGALAGSRVGTAGAAIPCGCRGRSVRAWSPRSSWWLGQDKTGWEKDSLGKPLW